MYKTMFVAVAVATVCAGGAHAQTLRQGSSGDSVKRVQRALVLHGARIKIDGKYGPNTAAAVRAFQRNRSLPATGRVDAVTLRSLERPVQRGDRGSVVSQLQRELNSKGAGLQVDGIFGPATERALKTFQRSAGLSQSGDLDSSTLSKLLGSSGSAASGGSSSGGSSSGGALSGSHRPKASLLREARRVLSSNPSGFRRDYMAIVDFSKHSSQKRLYVIDLRSNRVEAWKVAHGSGSDPSNTGYPQRFSNRSGSKMSSLGVYRTAETYNGKYGYSLRLDGLSGSNSRVRSRAVVMHPSAYVREGGTSGRSWGCFAIDKRYSTSVIKKLKGGALIYAGR